MGSTRRAKSLSQKECDSTVGDDKEKMDAFLSERQERRTGSQVYGEA